MPVGGMFTITTITSGHKGSFDHIPESSPPFPLDYVDDFQSTEDSQNARWVNDGHSNVRHITSGLFLKAGCLRNMDGPGGLRIKSGRLKSIAQLMARRA